MALKPEIRTRLDNCIDYNAGGLLTAAVNKADAMDVPILIIGLGGSGVDALISTKKMIYDRLKCEVKNDGGVSDKPRNIEYLAIDTDQKMKNSRIGGVGFSEALNEVKILNTSNLQAILKSPALPSNIKTWVDMELGLTNVTDGAGGVRQGGRFMLFNNLTDVMDVIGSKIEKVTEGYPDSVPLYVYIISGISGGTGSGTFLDIPYIVKGIGHNINPNRIIRRIGLLFLPDVNANKPGINDVTKNSIYRNGYASLKELDYLMNLSSLGGYYEQDYIKFKVTEDNDGKMPPYDTCMLLSSRNANGVTGLNAYNQIIETAAETVVNFVAAETNNSTVADFTTNEWISNAENERTVFRNLQGNNVQPYGYVYQAIGAASTRLPLDELMSYLAYKAFDNIDAFWHRNPSQDEVDEVAKELKLDSLSLFASVQQGNIQLPHIDKYTFDMIKGASGRIIEELDANLWDRERYIDKQIAELAAKLRADIENPEGRVMSIYKNVQKGPVAASKLLVGYAGTSVLEQPCLLGTIKKVQMALQKDVKDAKVMDTLRKKYQDILSKEIMNRPALTFTSKGTVTKEFLAAIRAFYNALYDNYTREKLIDLCTVFLNIVNDINSKTLDNSVSLFSKLAEMFQRFSGLVGNVDRAQLENANVFSWDIVSPSNFIRTVIEKAEQEFSGMKLELEKFVSDFYSDLFSENDFWSGNENGDIVGRLNDFISNEFESVLNKSMDVYIQMIAAEQNKSVTDYYTDLIRVLDARAIPAFPIRHTYSPMPFNSTYTHVSVPQDAPQLKSVIATASHKLVKTSDIKDRIMILKSYNAMPLAAYAELEQCHESYEVLKKSSHGLHLMMGSSANWSILPSPSPMEEWNAGNTYDEKELVKKCYEYFKKAYEYGFIKNYSAAGKKGLYCTWGKPVDVKTVAAKYNISDLENVSGISSVNAEKFKNELLGILNSPERLTEKQDMPYRGQILEDGTETTDLHFAEQTLYRMLYVRNKIYEMVDNYELCMKYIKAIEPLIYIKSSYVDFIKIWYLGAVVKNRAKYFYTDIVGMQKEFCMLQGTENNYWIYYLITKYSEHKVNRDAVASELDATVAKKIRMMNDVSDEEYSGYIDKLKSMITDIEAVL